MTAFDAHAHVIVPDLLRDAAPGETWRPAVSRVDGRQVVELDGRSITSAVEEFVDLAAILADRAAHGIDGVLLCPWVPLLFYDVPAADGLERCRLVLSGTMERHPRLRVLLAHGGGAIVALRGRLRHGRAHITAAGPPPGAPDQAADALIRRFLFDTVTHDPALLADLVRHVGADRVLLGSDYPFDMADPDPVATVRAAGLDEAAQAAVLHANAERELRRVPVAGGQRA